MYYEFRVKIPEVKGKIYYRTIKGVKYVNYEYDRIYKPDKKYNIPKRTTIGKVCEDDPFMMYPNPTFIRYFPDTQLPVENMNEYKSNCLKIGTYLVIRKLISESMLERIYEDERGRELFFDLVTCKIIEEDYEEYAYHHPLLHTFTDSTVISFINEITHEDSKKFFNAWNKTKDHERKICISFDTSSEKNSLLKVALACNENKEPLFYEEVVKSNNDLTHLQYMIETGKEYGYQKAGFILDEEYSKEKKLHNLDQSGIDDVIVKTMMYDALLEVKGTFEEKRSCMIKGHGVNAITVKRKLYEEDPKERYVHVYFDVERYAAERKDVEEKIEKFERYFRKFEGKHVVFDSPSEHYFSFEYDHEEQCFVKAIEEEMKMCGYYCIVTSEKMNASEALSLYEGRVRNKELISDKGEGWLLISFVAMILRRKMAEKLKEETDMNVTDAIRELERIEMIKDASGTYHLVRGLYEKQKIILNAFDMNENDIKTGAKMIGMRMK